MHVRVAWGISAWQGHGLVVMHSGASTCQKDQGDLIVSSGEQKRGQGVVEHCSQIVIV